MRSQEEPFALRLIGDGVFEFRYYTHELLNDSFADKVGRISFTRLPSELEELAFVGYSHPDDSQNDRLEYFQRVRDGALKRLESQGFTFTQIDSPTPVDPPDNKRKSKRGPHRYSREEKIAALQAWENLDKEEHPINLDYWLEEWFGAHPDGSLKVAPSTFYGWKKLVETS